MSSRTSPTQLSIADEQAKEEKGKEEGMSDMGKSERDDVDGKCVTKLDPEEDPKQKPKLQRWIMTLIICASSLCVTYSSSVVSPTFILIARSELSSVLGS